jgi:uncharacterized membrane protein YhhN
MGQLLWLLPPLLIAIVAVRTEKLRWKMSVPLLCALLLLLLPGLLGIDFSATIYWVVAAFVFSATGDYFLSQKEGAESYFVIGIAFYFFAHIGYLMYALQNGRLSLLALALLLILFLPYFYRYLRPAIADTVLRGAVLLYLLISCLALAAAFGLAGAGLVRGLFFFGMSMILLSDTVISLSEFLRVDRVDWLILPTYYLAHLTITAALLVG